MSGELIKPEITTINVVDLMDAKDYIEEKHNYAEDEVWDAILQFFDEYVRNDTYISLHIPTNNNFVGKKLKYYNMLLQLNEDFPFEKITFKICW